MLKSITSTIRLNNGVDIPALGLGVYLVESGGPALSATLSALEAGYRHIDTAKIYGNEEDVGEAVIESGIPRGDIFITTKLWNDDQGMSTAIRAFEKSLKRLKTDYVDLYLIHWPVPELREEAWTSLEKIYKDGRAKAIGVSNYTIQHLEELKSYAEITPAVNQVEFNPFLYQSELLAYCKEHNIQLEAYTPLCRTKRFDDPLLQELSGKYGKSPAQLMIRWSLQHDLVVIPKSQNPNRIRENSDVFDFSISDDDMKRMDALDEGYRVSWDPTGVE